MMNSPHDVELELERDELNALTDAVLTKYGYDFSNYAQSSFKRRVIMVLKKHGIKGMPYLIERVLNDSVFFDQFLLDITVNTTEMFRDPSFWKFLRLHVLPDLAQRPEFSIWHAACSTGEEIVSMAIMLKEEGLLEKAKLYATDINHKVLKKAAEVRFPLRNIDLSNQNYLASEPRAQLDKYYKKDGTEAVFDKALLEKVRFKHHDLAVDQPFYKFDLILCRNVMIYFNQQLQNRVFGLMHESLFMGGYLALGAKESLIWCRIADKFETVNDHEKVFRKVKL